MFPADEDTENHKLVKMRRTGECRLPSPSGTSTAQPLHRRLEGHCRKRGEKIARARTSENLWEIVFSGNGKETIAMMAA